MGNASPPRYVTVYARTGKYTTKKIKDVPCDEHEALKAAMDAALDDVMAQVEATAMLHQRERGAFAPIYRVGLLVESYVELTVPVWELSFNNAWERFRQRWRRMGHEHFWTYKSVVCLWNDWNLLTEHTTQYVVTLHTTPPSQ